MDKFVMDMICFRVEIASFLKKENGSSYYKNYPLLVFQLLITFYAAYYLTLTASNVFMTVAWYGPFKKY